MVKWCNLLDGNLLAGGLMNSGAVILLDEPYRIDPHHLPYDTVSALTDHILNFVLIGDIERDLPRSSY